MTDLKSDFTFSHVQSSNDSVDSKQPRSADDQFSFPSIQEEVHLEFDEPKPVDLSRSDFGFPSVEEPNFEEPNHQAITAPSPLGGDKSRPLSGGEREWAPSQEVHPNLPFTFRVDSPTRNGMHHNLSSTDVTYGNKEKGPKVVKNYVLGEVVGEGAFGKVREAVHSETLRRVAVKILKKRALRKIKGGEECIRNEIAIMRKLKKHKNVVELIDVINDDVKEKMYIVLEFVGGGSLQDMIDSIPDKGDHLPVFQWKLYFRQLIEGLDYIHRQGIVHRDIKPGNLMIAPDGTLKISDFGVAEELNQYESHDIVRRCMGSPAFQPPQIAKGADKFSGFKLDIWACGVTLYLLATGRLPFEGQNIYQLFANIAKGEFTIPSDVDPQLADLIRHMLDPNEATRYSIEDIMRHPWFLKEEHMPAMVGGQPETLSRERSFSFRNLFGSGGVGSGAQHQQLSQRSPPVTVKPIGNKLTAAISAAHDLDSDQQTVSSSGGASGSSRMRGSLHELSDVPSGPPRRQSSKVRDFFTDLFGPRHVLRSRLRRDDSLTNLRNVEHHHSEGESHHDSPPRRRHKKCLSFFSFCRR